MEYRNFEEHLVEELKKMNQESEIILTDVLRNNGKDYRVILIMEEGKNYSPNLYLEQIYDIHRRYGLSIKETAEYVMELYGILMQNIDWSEEKEKLLSDFQKIRGNLTIRMMNTEMNSRLLEEVAHYPFLDLSGVFYIADSIEKMNAAARVTWTMMDAWGITVEEMKETALRNLKEKADFRICGFDEVTGAVHDDRQGLCRTGRPCINIIMDRSRKNGPSVLLLQDKLKEFAEQLNDDLLLLPSSIHELIVTGSCYSDYAGLKQIVREVNDSVLDEEEILGYSVYRYSRGRAEVTIAA